MSENPKLQVVVMTSPMEAVSDLRKQYLFPIDFFFFNKSITPQGFRTDH